MKDFKRFEDALSHLWDMTKELGDLYHDFFMTKDFSVLDELVTTVFYNMLVSVELARDTFGTFQKIF